jgi:type IV secretory pathway VirB4 component
MSGKYIKIRGLKNRKIGLQNKINPLRERTHSENNDASTLTKSASLVASQKQSAESAESEHARA